MRTKQTKPVEFDVTIKLWTLRDKDSLFRAKEPDQHIVEIWANDRIIIREFRFEKAGLAEAHFQHLKSMFAKG